MVVDLLNGFMKVRLAGRVSSLSRKLTHFRVPDGTDSGRGAIVDESSVH
jgi:hypothetical protein